MPADSARAIAGTGAVLLGLAGGKWGAYLGLPPVFPIDVLLLAAGAHALAGGLLRPRGSSPESWPGWPLAAFVAYPVCRFVVGPDHSLTAIRDLAPYGYGLAGFLAAWSVAGSVPEQRLRTRRLLDAGLLFHLAWVALVLASPGLPARLPLINAQQQLHLLDIRLASDGTVVGVTAALYFLRLVRDGGRRHAVVLVVALWEVLMMASRASLLGTAMALAVMFWLGCVRADASTRGRRRRLALLGLFPAGLAFAVLVVPRTAPGSKLLSSAGLAAVSSTEDEVGLGTRHGRELAWAAIREYIAQTHHRGLGVGFGPDYLAASGARQPLGNSDLLRLPHSFVIGTYARLGVVGLALLAVLVLALATATVRLRQVAGSDDLLALAIVLPIAFLVSGAVGVQIESPFGAVPFYWCLGLLLQRARGGWPDVGPAAGAGEADATAGESVPAGSRGD